MLLAVTHLLAAGRSTCLKAALAAVKALPHVALPIPMSRSTAAILFGAAVDAEASTARLCLSGPYALPTTSHSAVLTSATCDALHAPSLNMSSCPVRASHGAGMMGTCLVSKSSRVVAEPHVGACVYRPG